MGGHRTDVRRDAATSDTVARASRATAPDDLLGTEPDEPTVTDLDVVTRHAREVPSVMDLDDVTGHAREVPPTAAPQPPGSAPPAPTARLIDRVPAALFAADTFALVIAAFAAGMTFVPAMVHVVVTLAVLVGRSLHRPRLTGRHRDRVLGFLVGLNREGAAHVGGRLSPTGHPGLHTVLAGLGPGGQVEPRAERAVAVGGQSALGHALAERREHRDAHGLPGQRL